MLELEELLCLKGGVSAVFIKDNLPMARNSFALFTGSPDLDIDLEQILNAITSTSH